MEPKYVIALDPGSSKIRAALGVIDAAGTLTVKAVEEEQATDIVCHGRVRNVADTAEAVKRVLQRLSAHEPSMQITGAYVALGGRSLRSDNRTIEHRLPGETQITDTEVRELSTEARRTAMPDRDILAVVPREYCVDRVATHKPVGVVGREISASFTILSARKSTRRNIEHMFDRLLNIRVNGYVVRPLAQAELVTTRDERRLGVVVVDMGAETTTVSVYKNNTLRYLATLPLGGRNITRDITTLSYVEEEAERLKRSADASSVAPGSESTDNREQSDVNNYVRARAGEIIMNVVEQIKHSGIQPADLPEGIILIGGGSRLKGVVPRMKELSRMNVSLGRLTQAVRLADTRIHTSDVIDVISVLCDVAADAEPCMVPIEQSVLDMEPEPEPEPEPVPEPEPDRIPTIGDIGTQQPPAAAPRKKLFDGWGQKLMNIVSKSMSEGDDEDLRDDK